MNPYQYKEPLYFSTELDFVIIIIVSILGIIINQKFLNDMKDDSRKSSPSLIDDVMASRTKSRMIVLPAYMLLNWSLTLDYQFSDWFYQALCYEQYNGMFWRFYFNVSSLIISLMRYFFIVYNEKVLFLGKQRVKNFFYFLGVVIPLIMTILHACTLPVPPSAHNNAHKTCQKYLEVSYNMTCRNGNGISDNCAPILSIVIEIIPQATTKVVGFIVKLMYIMMCSNILEGILYWRTFKLIREQNGKEFLRRTLSEESRKYRRQMVSVNIKITFLSWALECIIGISIIFVWAFAEEKAFRISGLFIQFIMLVIVPCTYILNRETTKQIIVLENLLNGLKATVMKREDVEVKVQRLEAERRNNAQNDV